MTLAVTAASASEARAPVFLHWKWTSVQAADDLNIVRGNHQFAFGASVLGLQSNSHHSTFTGGTFAFGNLADFMLGRMQSLTQFSQSEWHDHERPVSDASKAPATVA
jgi:hypothetical protein